MSQEKRLRKALEWLLMSRPLVPDEWWYHQQDREAWKDAVGKAQEALDATAGRTDMDKLEEWLEERTGWVAPKTTGYINAPPDVVQSVYTEVLDHIRTEFKEGDDATE